MTEIDKLLHITKDITSRYGLDIFYLDFTDITLISRFGLSSDIFIQIYVNIKKQKVNLALIVSGNRLYGLDKEGAYYHEHPFKNPDFHIKAKPAKIEDFVVKSIEYLKELGLI